MEVLVQEQEQVPTVPRVGVLLRLAGDLLRGAGLEGGASPGDSRQADRDLQEGANKLNSIKQIQLKEIQQTTC